MPRLRRDAHFRLIAGADWWCAVRVSANREVEELHGYLSGSWFTNESGSVHSDCRDACALEPFVRVLSARRAGSGLCHRAR